MNNISAFIICTSCGAKNDNDARFCCHCGREIQTNAAERNVNNICPQCGAVCMKTADGTLRCSKCGFGIYKEDSDKKENKTTLIIIVLLAVIVAISAVFGAYVIFNQKRKTEDNLYARMRRYDSNEEETENGQTTEDEFDEPFFEHISATSVLAPQGTNYYYPECAADRDSDTAWTEGADGPGIGEKITFRANTKQKVTEIMILNGYCKNESIYYKNNRVKTALISFSDGTSIRCDLKDIFFDYTTITLDEPIICTSFTLEIEDIYKGTDYDDTCISEIYVF